MMGGHRRAAAAGWGLVATLTDLLPPRLRYGYVHRAGRALARRPLPALRVALEPVTEALVPPAEPPAAADIARPVCVLAADELDIGGIGAVIEMLAGGLGRHGVTPVVVCQGDGARAARLRSAGIDVHSVADEDSARAALEDIGPAVLTSHSAPPFLERAILDSGRPVVPVLHNTEIHYTRRRWAEVATMMASAVVAVAVSTTVRDFHERRLGNATPIAVIPNGAPEIPPPTAVARAAARASLSAVIGAEVGDDVVFVCLARYDAQKNVAGLVAAFGGAAATDAVRLVYAGEPSDRVEYLRADALRRAGSAPDRIHLLGNSDARTLLLAADAFVLDSFFEGWPVAATEAAAHGHPLILSDVGGARELVARDAGRSVLIPNPTGPADRVSDARVSAARRRAARQTTAADLQNAVAAVARTVRAERLTGRPPVRSPGLEEMLAQHAALVREVTAGAA